MAEIRFPVRAEYAGSDPTGFTEYQTSDTLKLLDSAGNTSILLESSNGTATTEWPALDIYRNTTSPLSGDILGSITFDGKNSAGNKIAYAGLRTLTTGVTYAAEDGTLQFQVVKGGTLTTIGQLDATGFTITGNLSVTGTTTTITTTNTVLSDNLIELNNGAATNANDSGIVIERGSTGDNAIIAWDESEDKFTLGTTTATGASTGNLTITAGTLVANLEGNLSGNLNFTAISTTGTAAQATNTITGSGTSWDDTVINKYFIFTGTKSSGKISARSGQTLTVPVAQTVSAGTGYQIGLGVNGTAVKDEDTMLSDSDTHLATQQSIKAYVDTQIQTEDTIAELNDTIIASIALNNFLVYDTTGTAWKNLTPANARTALGVDAAGTVNYTHPTYDGDDIDIDTTPLTGATVISDLDFNVTTDSLGHVTDANAAISTRTLTASNIGAATTGKAIAMAIVFG